MSDPAACDIGCDEFGYPIPAMARARDAEMVGWVATAIRDTLIDNSIDANNEFGEMISVCCALAAIAAMREPTAAMLDATKPELPAIFQFGQPVPAFVGSAYRAALDAALGVMS